MNKVDTIKLRVTPDFKARVVREATYRGLSISELTLKALENEMLGSQRTTPIVMLDPDTAQFETALMKHVERQVEYVSTNTGPTPQDVSASDAGTKFAARFKPCVCGYPPWEFCPECDA